MSKKKHYRAIFISDIHLGSDHSRVHRLLHFLDQSKCDYLYILGDFVDFLHLYEHHGWSRKCNLLIRKLLSKVKKGTRVKIAIGNHDAFFGILSGFTFGNIEFGHEFVHHNSFVDYLVLHGDRFDRSMKHSFFVRVLSWIHQHWTWIPYLPFLKRKVDGYVERSVDLEALKDHADSHGCSGIIFGHTHRPREIEPGFYNCGDWVEHCSAVVETDDGEMEIIFFD